MVSTEFEFRAWDKLGDDEGNPCMRSWEMLLRDRYAHSMDSIFKDPTLILMQWTGLFDSTGKKIFQGDIIQWRGYEVANGKQTRPIRRRVVGHCMDPFRISFIDDCFHIQNLLEYKHEIEVIGNIYENPELMEEFI